MKLISRKTGTKVVNINGQKVNFVNGIAEVEDEFGAEILKLGLPDMYEFGKQPAYETPKEVQMKSEFKDKEEWYLKELGRLKNISDSRAERIKELEAEVKNWKAEYQKEHDLNVKLVSAQQPEPEAAPTQEEEAKPSTDAETSSENLDVELRAELAKMKKDELIQFGVDNGFDMTAIQEKTKAEIIEFLVESSK